LDIHLDDGYDRRKGKIILIINVMTPEELFISIEEEWSYVLWSLFPSLLFS